MVLHSSQMTIKMLCPNCAHEWFYSGNKITRISCPRCKRKINNSEIKRSVVINLHQFKDQLQSLLDRNIGDVIIDYKGPTVIDICEIA